MNNVRLLMIMVTGFLVALIVTPIVVAMYGSRRGWSPGKILVGAVAFGAAILAIFFAFLGLPLASAGAILLVTIAAALVLWRVLMHRLQ